MKRWIAVWLASLAVVAGFTIVLVRAQAPSQAPPDARVVSGADMGFRVEGASRTGEPSGTLVIRVNGAWVPVRFATDGLPRPAH